jgi:dTDP-glucose 4,6-dehydratase
VSWQGKKVLVTGAGGFIGSHLCERLFSLGAHVRAFIHYNAAGRCGWLDESPVREEIEYHAGDITDQDSVDQAMKDQEVIFHLAALIAIPYSYSVPTSYLRANVEGTINVLQAARRHGAERIVHTSTSEVYGTARYVPIDEKHPLQGQSPYSASKIGADKMAEAFHLSYGVPVITVRPFNTFGPRQSTRAIIPTIILQTKKGEEVRLGNLHPTRDLNYVDDTVSGFILAAECRQAVGMVLNIGSGQEISIGQLAVKIARLLGKEITIHQEECRVRPIASEVDRLCADSSLARRLLGWLPSYTLDEGLQKTIEWMNEHEQNSATDSYRI